MFRSLLASNPGDARAKALLKEAEQRQVETLYRRFAPTDIVSRVEVDHHGVRLRSTDLAVLDQLGRPRSVAVLSLVSPLRELETLLSISRLLLDKDLVILESAE